MQDKEQVQDKAVAQPVKAAAPVAPKEPGDWAYLWVKTNDGQDLRVTGELVVKHEQVNKVRRAQVRYVEALAHRLQVIEIPEKLAKKLG